MVKLTMAEVDAGEGRGAELAEAAGDGIYTLALLRTYAREQQLKLSL